MRNGTLLPPARPLPAGVRELRSAVRGFLAGELAAGRYLPVCDAWLSGWDESFSRRLAEQGWVGMTIPPEYGGGGRSALERYVVIEELLAAGAPVAAHWVSDRQVGPNLLRYVSEELKRRYLPAIARGRPMPVTRSRQCQPKRPTADPFGAGRARPEPEVILARRARATYLPRLDLRT